MHRIKYQIFMTTCYILVWGCSSRSTVDEEYSYSVTEERGVTVARTTNGPKYTSQLFTLEEVARVHEDDSIEGSLIARPRWMGIDEDGYLYVLDLVGGSAPRVRVLSFNPDGTFLSQMGRFGQGPGEYNTPHILSTSEGIVTIYDSRFRRLSWFSRDGTFLRLFTCAPAQALPERAYLDKAGNQILVYFSFKDGDWLQRDAILRSASGEQLGRIRTDRIPIYQGLEYGNGRYSTPPHFSGVPIISYSPSHGIMSTDGNTAVVEWYDLSGNLKKVFDLGLEPIPVSEEDRSLADLYFRDIFLSDNSTLGAAVYREWQRIDRFPKSRAFWNAATIDEYGYLWLEDPSSQFSLTERCYHVVSPEGEYLGDCVLPQGDEANISHGHYLLITRDRDRGIQEMVAYRLVSAVEGFSYPG